MLSLPGSFTKPILSGLFLIVVFLSGSTVKAEEAILGSSTGHGNISAGFVQAPNDTQTHGEPGEGLGGKGRQPGEDRAFIDERLRVIRERLQTDGADKGDECLIGENDLQPNIDIPIVFNDAVNRYIHYFTTTKKDLFKRWLKRKRRYAPLVRQILREHNLPEDLVYLAMIESGFNLQAYSPMKAAGPWQFIPETGKRYGLTVNHWIDERRDIRKSTVAAARYLRRLFDQFDCWYLAAAAYNSGENRIDRLIRRHDTKDFWQLRAYNTLPRETREYVPQLVAAAIIAKDPQKYGLGDLEYIPPLEFIAVNVPGGVPLEAIAEAASIELAVIKTLNPEIRRGITPPGKECRIKLPSGTNNVTFLKTLYTLLDERKPVVGVIQHTLGKKDSLQKITARYSVSKADLMLVNGSPLNLKKGGLVYIPQFNEDDREEGLAQGKTAEFAIVPDHNTDRRKRAFHIVQRGETLSSIAAKYGVRAATIKHDNNLKTSRIQRGMRLSLASHAAKPPQKTVEKYHRVRKGETLSQIADRYGTTIQSLRTLNRIKGNRVSIGMTLRVPS